MTFKKLSLTSAISLFLSFMFTNVDLKAAAFNPDEAFQSLIEGLETGNWENLLDEYLMDYGTGKKLPVIDFKRLEAIRESITDTKIRRFFDSCNKQLHLTLRKRIDASSFASTSMKSTTDIIELSSSKDEISENKTDISEISSTLDSLDLNDLDTSVLAEISLNDSFNQDFLESYKHLTSDSFNSSDIDSPVLADAEISFTSLDESFPEDSLRIASTFLRIISDLSSVISANDDEKENSYRRSSGVRDFLISKQIIDTCSPIKKVKKSSSNIPTNSFENSIHDKLELSSSDSSVIPLESPLVQNSVNEKSAILKSFLPDDSEKKNALREIFKEAKILLCLEKLEKAIAAGHVVVERGHRI